MKKNFPMGHKERRVYLSTVSGVATTKPDLIRYFEREIDAVDIITTKSFQVTPNPGNREPVICETEAGHFGNSVGLRNPGLEASLPPLLALRREGVKKWLNVSLSADNPDDFITLVKAFDQVADSVELNFSCPHAKEGFGASIGTSKKIASEYVEKIHNATKDRKALLFIKLTPNVPNIGEIAKAVIEKGADGISAINTVGPVVHTDTVSNTPILQNALGGKGGKSGRWVFSRAIECIKEIREAVGDDVPVIGMGGVWSSPDAAAMVEAGADAVGVGSVLAHVGQKNWKEYFSLLKAEGNAILKGKISENKALTLVSPKRVMEYKKYRIVKRILHSEDTLIITLDGDMKEFKAGEFVFLWIPGVGEKPFSVASSSPLSFIVKKRGIFTSHLFSVEEGDEIFLRGPYGAEVDTPKTREALIIAGGTGEAVALPLSKLLKEQGTEMRFLVGTSVEGNRGILEKELSEYGSYTALSDNGKPGRILDMLPSVLEKMDEDSAYYLIGPEIFMKIAAGMLKEKGISSDRILLSMEKNTMCGIGLCGECSCGGRLSCQWGTFMSLSFLEKEKVLC